MKIIFPLTLLALSSSAAFAASDTRSHAMGGTSVASSNYLSASIANPSLLQKTVKENDDFGILLPSVNFQIQDQDELFDSIDDFQDSFENLSDLLEQNNYQNGGVSEDELKRARAEVAANLARLNGQAFIEGNIAAATAIPTQAGGFSLFVNADFDLVANVMIDDNDLVVIANADTPDELESIDSETQFVGASITDAGFSYSNQYSISEQIIYWSVTPKFQQVDTFNYVVSVDEFDEDDFDANDYTNSDSQFNIDFGLATELMENVTLGFTASNLIENEFKAITHRGLTPIYTVGPEFKLGVAYANDTVTFAADVDLNAAERLSLEEKSQYARVGLELNGFDWVQLRAGYSHDFKGEQDDFVSVGFGFSPFGTVRLDVTAQKANDNELGAGIQLAFTI
ncbi:conjugal transfer protein TraF [Pseudoalteromonas sp. ZZD1]|uniref:conjugal transfer protein TraF n=1 Tax=Pseudoalteromonas sp. ZZD1 TaxID=3139395 RepID=UPI003BA910E2